MIGSGATVIDSFVASGAHVGVDAQIRLSFVTKEEILTIPE